ncbi:MAG: family 16 glycosylhydrolase [Phycisphaerae bacterium]|nr:family 16 glycosylhydrolase [Phycisphaerae bacterium]
MKKKNILQICFCFLLAIAACGDSLAGEGRPGKGWVKTGQLGAAPRRVTEDYPLSDQANERNWAKHEVMSDEFSGAEIDGDKWWPRNPRWLGRQPAYFYPGNVTVSDGKLHLAMKKQQVPEMPKDKGYHTYTSAAVQSKTKVKYGYFEAKCRPMKSHGSSSFWFYNSTPELWTEIDVFEIGGGAPGFEKKYNMNVHVFKTPTEKEHWSRHGAWVAPSNLADDYHTYGLEWDSDEIKWYFDGVLVRSIENTHWHQPLTLNFDSETMPEWFGLPKDSDLPSVYSIEYVRAWKKSDSASFVQVSPRDERYFELSNGTPHVPIGLNMIAPWGRDEKEALATMERWIKALSENRGNYIRLWLSHNFFDVEHERSGQYDSEKAKRIDAVLDMARRHNVRVKMTVEHFRHFFRDTQSWAAKPIHHVSRGGPAEDIDDFFKGQESREQFKKKLRWYADRYGDDPVIFAWELWNEMDTVRGKGYMEWTEEMLAELKELFPNNLLTQSLGSFDNASKRQRYRRVSLMKDNDFANVHRYLDLGASLEICKGPVDVLAADAIRELQNFEPTKPIILAESGAVEPGHTGPFKLYKADKAGIILHDIIFAPFFAGAAGTGQNWHWDHYVAANNLWFQFDRFAEAIKGVDPPAEAFEPIQIAHPRLRIYALKGRHTLLAWCRDKQNTWETELAQSEPPAMVADAVISVTDAGRDFDGVAVGLYDPWSNRWTRGRVEGNRITLPHFTRSLVVKMRY